LPPSTPPPPGPLAAYPAYAGPNDNDSSLTLAGESVPSVDVFFNDLATIGNWFDDPENGWVFAPPSSTIG
jgi:hypothetical protein